MPGFEPYLPATSRPGGSLEFGEQPAGDTAAADAGHYVHPFDLGHPLPRLGEDPHPAAPDGLTREVDDEKPPAGCSPNSRLPPGRLVAGRYGSKPGIDSRRPSASIRQVGTRGYRPTGSTGASPAAGASARPWRRIRP